MNLPYIFALIIIFSITPLKSDEICNGEWKEYNKTQVCSYKIVNPGDVIKFTVQVLRDKRIQFVSKKRCHEAIDKRYKDLIGEVHSSTPDIFYCYIKTRNKIKNCPVKLIEGQFMLPL